MATMNISLPETLKTFVDSKVAGGAYATSSEYVRDLIRREQDLDTLRGLIVEGMQSPSKRIEDNHFAVLRDRVRKGDYDPPAD